jgi:hypothetical protein
MSGTPAPPREREIERPGHDQGETDVERPGGLERRIEGEHDGGGIGHDGDRRQDEARDHHPEGRPAKSVHERCAEGAQGDERNEAADEERRPHQHVQHAVQADAVVVGLHQEVRRDMDARERERLQEPGDHAAKEGDEPHGHVGAGQTSVGHETAAARGGGNGGGRHGRGSTIILPAMVW